MQCIMKGINCRNQSQFVISYLDISFLGYSNLKEITPSIGLFKYATWWSMMSLKLLQCKLSRISARYKHFLQCKLSEIGARCKKES